MKQKRSLNIIADFIDGYAKDWYFAVGEYYRDSLDIKMTERIEPIILNGKKQYESVIVDGITKQKLLTKKVLRWTQGDFFSFAEGYILYDTPKAYQLWSEALKHINLCCQIVNASPRGVDNNGYFVEGFVTFLLLKPNSNKSNLETIGQYRLTQRKFVDYLKSGKM